MAYVLTPSKDDAPAAEAVREVAAPAAQPAEDVQPAEGFRAFVAVWAARIQAVAKRLVKLTRRPLPPKELILFSSQLSIMIETGTALVSCLEALEVQAANQRLRRALASMRVDIKSGQMFSTAMGRHRDVFPETMISMVAIGESGGFLDQMLERMSTILEKQAELRSTIRAAFTYPLVLAGFCVLVVGFMMAFILPRFVSIFADMQAALPLPTRMLLGSVDFLKTWWMVLIPGTVVVVTSLVFFFNRRTGRRLLDRWLLSIPVAGGFIQNVVVARLMRCVGEMLHAGVPLLEALQVSRPLVGNSLFQDMIRQVEASITSGKTLSAPIGESGLVPATVQQMLHTGESTGTLADTMVKIADFYDARAKAQAKDLTVILEPAMIFLVGGIVGFVVLSLLLPVFKISSAMH
jgi:type IV pilus assembly protein PilC